MYLYLLEITYNVDERAKAEEWLTQAQLDGVIVSVEQYNDEILAVLANKQSLADACHVLRQQPLITSCEGKRRAVYRITTATASEHVLCSFPFRAGEEWYLGPGNIAYLCVQSPQLCEKQMAWLTSNPAITAWRAVFDLIPMLPAPPTQADTDDVIVCEWLV